MSLFEELQPKRQYFRVSRGPCWDALIEWREKRNAISSQCFEFAKSQGGTGFYPGHDDNVGNATAIAAVVFAGDPPKGWKRRKWKSFVITEGQTPAWPDRRTTAGREALAAIKKLPLRPSSNRVCDAIGFPHSIEYSKHGECQGCASLAFWDTMTVGWSGDTFYVGLPRVNEEIAKYRERGYTVATPEWTPLDGMEPILKEEVDLDFARAKLAREKEAA